MLTETKYEGLGTLEFLYQDNEVFLYRNEHKVTSRASRNRRSF